MLRSVLLAHDARVAFSEESNGDPTVGDVRLALSLGPFGASLSPAQEFDGYYPPPYGPQAFSAHGINTNTFGGDIEKEDNSIKALAKFHFDRLMVFVREPNVWSLIDCIAFETIPLAREVKAIRQAMEWLQSEVEMLRSEQFKPWWISFVFPEGECPEARHGSNLGPRDLVAAALANDECHIRTEFGAAPVPTGLGINCTAMDHIPDLISEMERALKDFVDSGVSKPWLVVYPNGGDVYDPVSRTWKVKDVKGVGDVGALWAASLAAVAKNAKNSKETGDSVWSGVVVGGCCRTGPKHILALSQQLALIEEGFGERNNRGK